MPRFRPLRFITCRIVTSNISWHEIRTKLLSSRGPRVPDVGTRIPRHALSQCQWCPCARARACGSRVWNAYNKHDVYDAKSDFALVPCTCSVRKSAENKQIFNFNSFIREKLDGTTVKQHVRSILLFTTPRRAL